MPINEELAEKARKVLGARKSLVEKRMFGGLAFMFNGKMCCGVIQDDLVVRIDPADQAAFLRERGARPMDFTGRPMKGYVYVDSKGYGSTASMKKWLDRAVRFTETLSVNASRAKRKSNRPKRSA